MKKKLFYILLLLIPVFLTGCRNDSMDNIEIVVTNYPIEFIVNQLYSNHSTISSIYPDGVDTNKYVVSSKQKKEYAKKDLFIYNGLVEKERSLALELLAINPDLKIIDTAYVLETDYSPEELWLNPSSLLMMSQNVRLSLEEYATSSYLKKEVETAYDELKIQLSELDAEYRLAFDSTDNKTVVVADTALNYLEKFNLSVISIDDDASQKTIADVENLFKNQSVNYIFLFEGEDLSDNAKNLLDNYSSVQTISLHKLDNLSDSERSEKENYISLMKDNLELIKKELYQ